MRITSSILDSLRKMRFGLSETKPLPNPGTKGDHQAESSSPLTTGGGTEVIYSERIRGLFSLIVRFLFSEHLSSFLSSS
jgi:hypothetical protein